MIVWKICDLKQQIITLDPLFIANCVAKTENRIFMRAMFCPCTRNFEISQSGLSLGDTQFKKHTPRPGWKVRTARRRTSGRTSKLWCTNVKKLVRRAHKITGILANCNWYFT